MKIENVPFSTTDWSQVTPVVYTGENGTAFWRTVETGNVRMRIVGYSADYLADHWCSRGHVLLVLEGELIIELEDGRKFTMTPGMSFSVADGIDAHRVFSQNGAKVFIVD
jgi:quercetin dioxygenase-like cupin family protein